MVARLSQALIADNAELAIAASQGQSHPVIGLWSVAVPDAATLSGAIGAAANRLHAVSLLALRLDRGRHSLGFILCAYQHARVFDAATDLVSIAAVRLASASLDFARRTSHALDRADGARAVPRRRGAQPVGGAIQDRLIGRRIP